MNDPIATADRRANPQLRAIFIEVYDVLAPFFDPANSWGGLTHEHLAYRALREQFPQLSIQEVSILVTAAKRVFHGGGQPADP
jgi:hypothetical protein